MSSISISPAPPPKGVPATSTRFYDELLNRVRVELLRDGEPGMRLPSERHLAQRYGVSNVTIARVLRDLQTAGVLRRVPSKGTFLTGLPAEGAAARGTRTGVARTGLDRGSVARTGVDRVTGRAQHSGAEGVPVSATAPRAGVELPLEELRLWVLADFAPDYVYSHEDPWALRATSAIERMVQRGGGRTMLTNLSAVSDYEAEIQRALARDINAVLVVNDRVLLPEFPFGRCLMRRALARGPEFLPVVLISFRSLDGRNDWPFPRVRYSEELGIFQSVALLVQQGHKEIAYLLPKHGPQDDFDWVQLRSGYFERAIHVLGPGVRGHLVAGPPVATSVPRGEDEWSRRSLPTVQRFLDEPEWRQVTAAITINDAMGRVLLGEARKRGRRIPEELSVIGFDDSAWANTMGLTTVHVPIEEMAARALAMLGQITVNAEPVVSSELAEVQISPALFQRETTRQPDVE